MKKKSPAYYGLLFLGLFIFIGLNAAIASTANGLRVSPLRMNVYPEKPLTDLSLVNLTDKKMAIELSAVAWSQKDGADQYMPTTDIFFAPPILVLEPKETKIIRFRVRKKPSQSQELTYRIFVRQLLPPDSLRKPEENAGISVKVRLSLPLFVFPVEKPVYKFAIENQFDDNNDLIIKLSNSGNMHIRVPTLSLYSATVDRETLNKSGTISEKALYDVTSSLNSTPYALPGQTQSWKFDLPDNMPVGDYWLLIKTDVYDSRSSGANSRGFYWQKITVLNKKSGLSPTLEQMTK